MSETRSSTSQSPVPIRAAGIAAGLGAWILWSAVILTGSGPIIISNVLAGALIAAAASYAAAWPDGGPLPALVAPAVTILLALWVIASPFVLEITADRVLWSNVIAGVLVVTLAAGSLYGSLRGARSTAARA